MDRETEDAVLTAAEEHQENWVTKAVFGSRNPNSTEGYSYGVGFEDGVRWSAQVSMLQDDTSLSLSEAENEDWLKTFRALLAQSPSSAAAVVTAWEKRVKTFVTLPEKHEDAALYALALRTTYVNFRW